MDEPNEVNKDDGPVDLPPGFRFHPTDEEIITCYLSPKAIDRNFSSIVIGEVDMNKCEPWDMPRKAKMGEKEWYFFCHRDRKYPTGTRTNRATESGYWKATGKDKEIFHGKDRLVGMKKTLVFYHGRAPRGEKTDWVMHEFRLEGKLHYDLHRASKDDWVVCRVLHKNITGVKKPAPTILGAQLRQFDSFVDDDQLDHPFSSTPPLIGLPCLTEPTSSAFNGAVEDNEFKLTKGVDNYMDLDLSSSSLFIPKSSDGKYFYFPSGSSELHDQMVIRNNSGYSRMMNVMTTNQISPFLDPLSSASIEALGSISPKILYPKKRSHLHCKEEQCSDPHRESTVSLSQDTSLTSDIDQTTEKSYSNQQRLKISTLEDNIANIDYLWDL
ncbi:hypothetical protein SAY86_023395 [Trapa natans]|uniref:NAC domain-containing protein n=1 Tax=Trapa natans TaxID=22666 RepID=A0AAN7LUY0_TRANT|nr:hypothetical protein SAY86_023395 [Trapa natans]